MRGHGRGRHGEHGTPQGLSEEQLARSARVEEAWRQASHAVSADRYGGTPTREDRVKTRSRLHPHVVDQRGPAS
ncbi:hypothetical protein ABTY61_28245 [Kitasatospora sp. NPDC096128]|uniref:hypothetical protein n=1 Tax=Kitasatospora sp. NPDC096128 TaxID=3155547 RepID=UPI0033195F88